MFKNKILSLRENFQTEYISLSFLYKQTIYFPKPWKVLTHTHPSLICNFDFFCFYFSLCSFYTFYISDWVVFQKKNKTIHPVWCILLEFILYAYTYVKENFIKSGENYIINVNFFFKDSTKLCFRARWKFEENNILNSLQFFYFSAKETIVRYSTKFF